MSSPAIGIGAFILIGLWSSSFILCLLSLRTRHSIGPIVFIITIFITIILLSVPRSTTEDTPKTDNKIVDPLFFWRLATLSLLILSATIGLAALFSSHVMSRKTVPQLKSWVL